MPKVIVLGGCGAVGSVAARTLAAQDMFSEVTIGDRNMERARQIIAETKEGRVRAVEVDAESPESIREAVKGHDMVLNCVGPFYKSVKTILGTVLDMGPELRGCLRRCGRHPRDLRFRFKGQREGDHGAHRHGKLARGDQSPRQARP